MTYLKNGDPRICPDCKEVWCWKVDTKLKKKRVLKKHTLSGFPKFGLPKDICLPCRQAGLPCRQTGEDCKNI